MWPQSFHLISIKRTITQQQQKSPLHLYRNVSPVVLWEDNGTGVSCNLVSATIDQLDLCAITSLFQSTVVIMSPRERETGRARPPVTRDPNTWISFYQTAPAAHFVADWHWWHSDGPPDERGEWVDGRVCPAQLDRCTSHNQRGICT